MKANNCFVKLLFRLHFIRDFIKLYEKKDIPGVFAYTLQNLLQLSNFVYTEVDRIRADWARQKKSFLKRHADDKLLCKVPSRICVVAAMLGKN